MAPFQGRLLVGVGRLLRIYDIGKKKMLRKCENKHLPNLVVDIRCMGNRIYVSDVQEAVHFIRYKASENQLVIFADEPYQRLVYLCNFVCSHVYIYIYICMCVCTCTCVYIVYVMHTFHNTFMSCLH